MSSPWPLPKILFHIGLVTILLFGLGVFVLWSFALFALFARGKEPEARRWTRRLVALAVVDSVLVASFGGVMVPQLLRDDGSLSAPMTPRVIGVALSERSEGGLEVASVRPGGPAQKAGVQAGDVLVAVDGHPVMEPEEAQALVSRAAGDVELALQRDGEDRTLRVTPVPASRLGSEPEGLFTPSADGRAECLPYQTNRRVPWALLLSAVALLVLYLFGRRRGMDATLLWCGALLVGASFLTQAAALATCLQVGGPSRGAIIVALYVQTVVLGLGGLLLTRRMRRSDPAPEGHSWTSTALFGALYMLTGAVRVGILLLVLQRLLGETAAPYSDSLLHQLAGSGLSWQGAVAFVIPVALLGPVSEELFFRGAVLPWLARWMRPFAAIAVSGVLFGALHLFYGPFVLIVMYYGLVLGWARLHSGGLKAPIALHIAINATACAVLLATGMGSG